MQTIQANTQPPLVLQQGNTTAAFTSSGDLFEFSADGTLINLYQGNALYGSANNLWLRFHTPQGITAYPLLGRASKSDLRYGKHWISYHGTLQGVDYKVRFVLADPQTWFWQVELSGTGATVDLLYGQDIGIAAKGAVQTNELYSAQYLDYRVYENPQGYHVCARQNMSQEGANPYLQQGLLQGKAVGFSTEGMEFFGTQYKASHQPAALTQDLPSKILQGEFSYTGLQTQATPLDGRLSLTFYGYYSPDLPTAILSLENLDTIKTSYDTLKTMDFSQEKSWEVPALKDNFGAPYSSPSLSQKDIALHYPQREMEEKDQDTLLSFFTPEHSHVVLPAKEIMVERAHGNIITTFVDTKEVEVDLATSTNYMYGLFHAQTLVGNTTYHKLFSANRGFLNLTKTTGQRLYIKWDEEYRLLTLPAVYEMGMNYSLWYYVLPNKDILKITAFSVSHATDMVLQVESQGQNAYDFILTQQLVLGEHEFTQEIQQEILENGSILRYSSATPGEFYPDLSYDIQLPGTDFLASDDRVFYQKELSDNPSLLTLSLTQKSDFQLIVSGHLQGGDAVIKPRYTFQKEKEEYQRLYRSILQNFSLSFAPDSQPTPEIVSDTQIINHTAWWYAHNGLVHYASPHGLEQSGGAAWGTRDVCQGPMEFFFTFQQYDMARSVLLTIFSHQQEETGEWPQWFMYDNYPYNAGDCHGDVVFWPLKSVSEYLTYTGDTSLLEEKIPYQQADGSLSHETTTVLEHIQRAFDTITHRFLPDTHLISYAGGDWNDTLQPANPALRKNLVSTWTQALAYQALHQLGNALEQPAPEFSKTLLATAKNILADFQNLLIQNEVVTGFVHKEADGSYRPMLHPHDTVTGIHYRMLPMTRSIIATMAAPAQAKRNMELIDQHLLCPDGARLMDHPPRYNGGVSQLFERAEQATYVGREISLMYTHAHIRYMEALAAMDCKENAWKSVFQINPMALERYVPNAQRRQKNLYFSSSEGAYTDRYDFSKNYDKLRTGDIPVKGGWRLYSSGPGIYLHQLISNILGIHVTKEALSIRPSLPASLDGLILTMTCFGKTVNFVYHLGENPLSIAGKEGALETTTTTSPYGKTTLTLSKEEFLRAGDTLTITN